MKKFLLIITLIIFASSQAKAIYYDDDSTIEQGYRGFVEFDYALGLGDISIDRISVSTSHGFQIAPQFFIGAGATFSYYYDNETCGIPLFVHMRSDILDTDITPFVDVKIGYSVGDLKGVYLNPSVGCRFALTEDLGLSVGVGYTMNKCDNPYYPWYDSSKKKNIGGINIRIGIDF